jgi:hypothetical protein
MSFPPSDAQWNYISRLCTERHPNGAAAFEVLKSQRLTRDGASKVIDALRNMPVLAEATPVAPAADDPRGSLPYNRYSGRCVLCRVEVAAQAGTYRRGANGKWETLHLPGQCPKAEVETKPRRSFQDIIGDLPDGHYAVPSVTGSNDLTFVRLGTNKGFYDPSKKGQRYIRHEVGGTGELANVSQEWVEAVVEAIRTLGANETRALYGQEIGSCGFCGQTLTREYSRVRGYGPSCADRWGMTFDHAAYRVSKIVAEGGE